MEYKTMEKAGGGKTYPVLCGNFMQPGAFKGYSAKKMKSHLQTMYDIGIDILVLQWSFENTSEGVTNIYYRSSFESADKSSVYNDSGENLLGNILEAAEAVGVKVFVGLNNNDEWWEKAVSDKAWLTAQAELGIKGARQIYDTYKKQYPNAFYGWYFVFEMYNTAATQEMMENGAYLLNGFCDGLTEIDAEMPMMLSPFLSAYGTEPEVTGRQWANIFAMTHFREGDIFCCQDSVGAGFITVDQLDGYFKAIKEAVDTKKGLRFWANNEDFSQESWGTASLDCFVKQMEIASKHVEAHITFAYSHHQHPDMGKTGHHEAYKYYYETGKLPTYDLASPTVTYEVGEEGVSISGTLPNENKGAMGFRIYKNGELLTLINLTKAYDKPQLSFTFTDDAPAENATYKVCAVDYRYQDGGYSEFTVNGWTFPSLNYQIRKALPSDAEQLKELYFHHLTHYPPTEEQNMEQWRALLSKFLQDDNMHLLVLEIEDRIVSTVQMAIVENLTHNVRPFAVIENVVTHADYRNQGYASALLQKASEIAKERCCYKLFLETGSNKESTLNFYRNNGFEIDQKHSCLKRL